MGDSGRLYSTNIEPFSIVTSLLLLPIEKSRLRDQIVLAERTAIFTVTQDPPWERVIINRSLILLIAVWSAFCAIASAYGQSDYPRNSLRNTEAPAQATSEERIVFSVVFDADQAARIDFELLSRTIADAVISDQQLADYAYELEHAAAYGPNEDSPTGPRYNGAIIYDADVRPASYDGVAGGGFAALSTEESGSNVPVDQAPATTSPSALLEEMPKQLSPALPQASAPQAVQTPFGPALPADFAFSVPISQQLIGDLLEEIQRQKDLLGTSQEDNSEEFNRRTRWLEESYAAVLQAKKFLKKDFAQRNAIKTFEADKKILEEKLAVDRKPQLPQKGQSAEDLFAHLENLRSDMNGLNARLNDQNETELQHKVRLSDIPKDRASARKRITEIDKQLTNEELGEADTFAMIRLRAEELELEYRIESLESESKLYELENRLMPLNSDLLAREMKILEEEIEAWNYAANLRRRLDLEEEARLARAKVIEAAPALRILAERNAELTERRIKFSEQVRNAKEEEIQVYELLNKVRSQHQNVENNIGQTLSQANGMLLVDIRRTMVRPFKSRQRIRQINRELREISLERIKINEQREPLSHPNEYVAQMLKGVHSEATSDEELSVMALEIVESIRSQYDQLSADHHTYTDLLGKILAEREELVGEIEATLQFVNRKSLWVRSAQPLGVDQIAKSRYAVSKFFSPAQWTQLMGELTQRCVTSPHESAAGLIGLISLFMFSRRFKA